MNIQLIFAAKLQQRFLLNGRQLTLITPIFVAKKKGPGFE
jgi:hypothetical protein